MRGAHRRLGERVSFWLTTLNVDGSPHVTSVGALWHAGSCWFQTGESIRKAKNVARDPRCSVSVATKGFDVMVAGEARRVTDPKIVAEIAALWAESGWPAQPDNSGTGITAPSHRSAARPARTLTAHIVELHPSPPSKASREGGGLPQATQTC